MKPARGTRLSAGAGRADRQQGAFWARASFSRSPPGRGKFLESPLVWKESVNPPVWLAVVQDSEGS